MAIRLPLEVRRLVSLPIRNLPFPILGGPNKGRLWSVAALGRGVLTGQYERHRFALLKELISRGDCVWDVGAHRGYATLIAAQEVGSEGSVVSFEPASVNRWYLSRHIRWNRITQARVLPFALGATDRRSTIGGAGSSVSFTMDEGTECIDVRTAASVVESGGLSLPTVLKVDVEGAEGRVLNGAEAVLGPGMLALISVHSLTAYLDCKQVLSRAGYTIYASPRLQAQLRGTTERWHGDPDLLAVGSERTPSQDTLDRFGFSITGRGSR